MKTGDFVSMIGAVIQSIESHGGAQTRFGQKMFNTLHERDPELANVIRGTEVDPFHVDGRIKDFLIYLLEHHVED